MDWIQDPSIFESIILFGSSSSTVVLLDPSDVGKSHRNDTDVNIGFGPFCQVAGKIFSERMVRRVVVEGKALEQNFVTDGVCFEQYFGRVVGFMGGQTGLIDGDQVGQTDCMPNEGECT